MSNSTATNGAKDEEIWYEANCHCGNVKYKIKLANLEHSENQVNSCNCSICTKNGYMLVYPSPDEGTYFSKSFLDNWSIDLNQETCLKTHFLS